MHIKKKVKPATANLHVRIPVALKDKVNEAARKYGVSVNELMIQVLEQADI